MMALSLRRVSAWYALLAFAKGITGNQWIPYAKGY